MLILHYIRHSKYVVVGCGGCTHRQGQVELLIPLLVEMRMRDMIRYFGSLKDR